MLENEVGHYPVIVQVEKVTPTIAYQTVFKKSRNKYRRTNKEINVHKKERNAEILVKMKKKTICFVELLLHSW